MSATEFATLDLFCELAAIPSPSGRERAVADRVLEMLRGLGLEPDEDDAGPRIGSEIGNIYCHVPPSEGASGAPIFFNAHLDTVPPTAAVDPVVADGIVTNANDTILGADNKAAVASMLIAVRDLVNSGAAHSGVELVITPMEEVGLLGAKAFDASRLRARFGYCYDHAAPIGNIVVVAPSQQTFKLEFRGRPAHSGIAPEDGRSAILAASRAIAAMPLGRIDEQTTANVGIIEGGVARNIVPPNCTAWAEARSRDEASLTRLSQQIVDVSTAAAQETGCEVEIGISGEYRGYRHSPRSAPVVLAREALEKAGFEVVLMESGGGADAHVFNAAGVPCVNLCNGMAEIHTADEWISVADLEAMTTVTRHLIDLAHMAE